MIEEHPVVGRILDDVSDIIIVAAAIYSQDKDANCSALAPCS
jgi:hypothetical protein